MARRRSVVLASLAALVACSAATSTASAQEDPVEPSASEPAPAPPVPSAPPAPFAAPETETMRYPLARATRPLTLPKLYMTATFDLSSTGLPAGRFTDATIGAALGITDDLMVRAVVAPLQLTSPDSNTYGGVHYGETAGTQGPTLTATYRFVHGDVELGAAAGGEVFTAFRVSGYRLSLGVPFRAHLSKHVRFDIGPELKFTRQTNEPATGGGPTVGQVIDAQGGVSSVDLSAVTTTPATERYALLVPLELIWSITDLVHLGMSAGYVASDLSSVKHNSRIPVGISGGYTIAGARGPLLDIDPYFDFPALLRPGNSSQKTQTDWNEVGVTFRVHVDLL